MFIQSQPRKGNSYTAQIEKKKLSKKERETRQKRTDRDDETQEGQDDQGARATAVPILEADALRLTVRLLGVSRKEGKGRVECGPHSYFSVCGSQRHRFARQQATIACRLTGAGC